MMLGSLQDVVVTLVAAAAAALVLRRVLGFARSHRAAPKCAACDVAAPSSEAVGDAGRPANHPLVVVRTPRP